jgi:hypothetical protein
MINRTELIERAERGEVIGTGTQQIRLLVERAKWAFDRLAAIQAAQVYFRDPERKMVCDIIANGFTEKGKSK